MTVSNVLIVSSFSAGERLCCWKAQPERATSDSAMWAAELLRSRSIPLVLTREPGGTPFGEELRHMLLLLVLGDSFILMFFGWEGVGLCSYLLIGFWYQRDSANAAAMKAFIVNRVGDFGFLLGIVMCWWLNGTVSFSALEKGHVFSTAIALLLFCGAVGKSAQLPLQVWLPDAMEGPTPVSALVHSATMVAAGYATHDDGVFALVGAATGA